MPTAILISFFRFCGQWQQHGSEWLAPAARLPRFVTKLNAEINKVLVSPAIRGRWLVLLIEPVSGTPERFTAHVKVETAKWTDVIKRMAIKGEY
jgi:tripartite-type tricarboxylate transporter receptor subunit TctC